MARYFLELSYLGSRYFGWQRQPQPEAPTVQEAIELALQTALRESIEITGCGRTDTGVHASDYFAHFDTEKPLPIRFVRTLNALLPDDIAIIGVHPVEPTAHARYDAFRRSYVYYIDLSKNPFAQQTAWAYPPAEKFSIEKMQEVLDLLQKYEDFHPFCKSNSGLEHFRVQEFSAHWTREDNPNRLVFHVSANRFLRGMVRLLVGCCVQVAKGVISLEEVKKAMDTQTLLPKPLSVPPQGLFLSKIEYPYSSKL